MPEKMISSKRKLMEAYEKISPKYSKVKTRPWKDFKVYFEEISQKHSLPLEGLLLDVGSGNGRNLLFFTEENFEFIVSDLSLMLLKNLVPLPKEKINTINNDVSFIPLRTEAIDLILCIAVLHHLSSTNEVLKAINTLFTLLKPGGYLIISFWRKWKKDTKKVMMKDLLLFLYKKLQNKQWKHGDILIPWYNSKKEIVAKRYYHLFSRREILDILKKTKFKIEDFKIHGGRKNKDNLFFLLKK